MSQALPETIANVPPYRQATERADLSIEFETPTVPADGRYYVLHAGNVVGAYRSLRTAQRKYKEILEGLQLPPIELDQDARAKAMHRAIAHDIVAKDTSETFARSARRRGSARGTRTYR